ncbi:hypothetical protein B7R22_02510 [Subtercola boreus]|uniref:Segregation/condensation protein A n=1 Tax=Subtercola boreus TaxID=120213 RepID=A0A3E0W3Q7_9MICO|nr:hypothetical protein [Subtercola boreus]RFA16379.1 hypothetical protein B7R22_02510 [Subtercola boreus]
MNIEPRDEKIVSPPDHPIEFLAKLLREDLFELRDGLLPPDIVDHVTQATLLIEVLSEREV